MKGIVRNTLLMPLVLLVSSLVGWADPIQISVSPLSQSVAVGGSAQLALRITGLGDRQPPSLSTFDVDAMFDSSVLAFSGFTFGDPMLGDQLDLLGLGSVTGTTLENGSVNLFELSLDSATTLNTLQAADFVLATLRFRAVDFGNSPVTIRINALGDASGAGLSASTQAGDVNVVVPEPGTFLLFALGLIVLGSAGAGRCKAASHSGTSGCKFR